MASERIQRRIDRLLDQIEQEADQQNWQVVHDLADEVLGLAPDNGDAKAFLVAAERRLSSSPGREAQEFIPSASAADVGPHPTSFANGRYHVKKFLGEGGKKKVYLAHDTVLDRDVAFALVKAEGLDESARQRISREARAMGRLGDHPHIMPIHDLGQEGGQPYLVLPLMGGGDVESLIEQAPDHRLPLDRALEIAQQICGGLQFAHAKGIIHRDLKPGNVWLTSDGTAKIGDFGLALPLDRPRLTMEGMMVGTVDYMPPEQALGGEVTPRADLYSLGCMVYEMVTGRPPFMGDDPVAIIGQHINTPPVAPTWHNGQCPRPLEALILRLLAKDPAERPGSAGDVLAALEAIDLSEIPSGPPLQRGDGGISDAHALDSLAGGVFVGRQREMGELKAALEDALSGRGRLLTLVGEPGIGKTRTAQELATYAGLRQCQVLWGRCYEGAGAPPYWPWVQAIRSYVRDREEQQLRSDMGAGAADIAEVVSDVRERLPDLKPPPQLEPEQARFRLFDSIAAFLKTAGRRQPLVLVLEDLHWADRPSLLLLEFLARELANSRLLVIGTYRDVEVSRRHPLSQTLGELTRERLFQRVLMRGLSQGDVGRFIELVSGLTPPRGLVEAVYRQTEGNPLFVTEVVRLLVQEGALAPHPSTGSGRTGTPSSAHGESRLCRDPDESGLVEPRAGGRESWTVRIPEGVREVIGRRLDRLSERCNQTLTIASVIGREFTLQQLLALTLGPSTLRRCSGQASSGRTDTPAAHGEPVEPGAGGSGLAMSEDRLLEVLDEALAARVIEELPRAVGRYQFSHALIQETLTEELTLTRRVRLHARIAEALEQLYGSDTDPHVAELAHHFAEAQTVLGTEKLVHYSLLAGERALAGYAWEEAQAHFERGLAGKAVPPEGSEPARDGDEAVLLFGLGRAQLSALDRYEQGEALANLRRAFDYYADAGDVARAVAVAAYPAPTGAGRSTGMAQLVARALTLVPPDSHQAGRLLSQYISIMGRADGDYEGAQKALVQAVAIAQREGDAALEMRALADAARVDYFHLRYQESLEKSLRAIELSLNADDPRAELNARYAASVALRFMGDPKGAGRHTAAMLAPAERLRDRRWLSNAFLANASVSSFMGNWQAARDFSDRGLSSTPRDGRHLALRVLLESEVGDFNQGQAYLERLLETMRLTAPGPTTDYGLPALVIPLVARITGIAGRIDVARAAAGTVLSSPSATPAIATLARAGLGFLAVQQADASGAGDQYAALESDQGTMHVGVGIAIDRLLGLLAQTTGNLDKAAEHFEDALAFCRRAGYRPELAWSLCDYADCLLQRAGAGPTLGAGLKPAPTPGDRTKAMSLLDEALRISRELGMRPLMERVLHRREILGA